MIKASLITALLVISLLSHAQTATEGDMYVDSLKDLQLNGTTDSIKARASFLLSDHYSDDFDKGKKELDEGLQFSKGNTFLTGLYHFYYGQLFFYKEPEKAIDQYGKSIHILKGFKSAESLETQARAWYNTGAQYDYLGNSKRFMELLTKYSIPLAKQAHSYKLEARYNYTIGMILTNIKDFPLAEEHYRKSLSYHNNTENTDELDRLEVLNGLTKNFLLQNNTDSTKPYLELAIPLASKHTDDLLYLNTKENEANYYHVMKNYAKSESVLRETIASLDRGSTSAHYRHNINGLYFQLHKSLVQQKKYQEARAVLVSIKDYLTQTPDNKLRYFSHMAELYEKMRDFTPAYDWLKQAYILRDSLYNDGYRNEINEMEKKLKVSENEKQIAQLQAEKKETHLTQKNQRLLTWLLGVGSAILLLAFLFVVYIYRNRQQRTALELQELEKQKQLDLTQAILEGEERERQRIARDLHDGLGGALSGIKIKLSGEQKHTSTPVIDETILQLENSIGELRRIARNMMPETLIRSGLEVALRDLCVSVSSAKTAIEFQPNGIQKKIPVQSQVNIYRIIQELLTNAVKHGKASRIIVQCIQDNNSILITVEDNGKGFDVIHPSQPKGIGMINVQNRVDLMKGKLQIDTAINEGTTVNIELYV